MPGLSEGLFTSDRVLRRNLCGDLLNEVKTLIMPEQRIGGYSLIIGEHGTGKTSLVRLAISEIKKPKGIAYVLIPNNSIEDTAIVQAVKKSLNWMPNLVDSQNGK